MAKIAAAAGVLILLLLGCGRVSGVSSYEDSCKQQGGTWFANGAFGMDVPITKNGTVVTIKRVTTQEYCVLP